MKKCTSAVFGVVLIAFGLGLCASPASAQVQVNSANPNNAAQGTINLDVIVGGSGFKKGAKAQWFVSGTTNPGGVTVNSTTFNSSNQLTANITVATGATIGGFDIVVTNSDGRSGKGTELFAVNTNSKTSCVAPAPINPVVNACMSSTAQSGCIDSSFGNSGQALLLDTGLAPQGAIRLQPQADGTQKIVVVNQTGSSATVARFNLDGTLDSTFGNAGVSSLQLEPTGTLIGAYDGLIDANRNILVGGYAGSDLFVMRFLPDGGVDTSFGTNGVFMYQGSSTSASGRALALQPDGKVVAVGQVRTSKSSSASLVLRLSSNGTLDSTFGSGGAASIASGPQLMTVALQTVGTTNYIVTGGNGWLGRLTPSGVLDSSFGSGGQVVGPTCGGTGSARSIYVDGSDNIFLLGYSNAGITNGLSYLNLTKYTASGVLDTNFGDVAGSGHTGDTFLNPFGGASYPGFNSSLMATTDSTGAIKLVVTGQAQTSGGSSTYSVLARYNLDGTLDPTLGGGVVARGFGSGAAWGMGSVVAPNGEIVSFTVWDNSGGYFALTRYWP